MRDMEGVSERKREMDRDSWVGRNEDRKERRNKEREGVKQKDRKRERWSGRQTNTHGERER